jgi:hypothetical protein
MSDLNDLARDRLAEARKSQTPAPVEAPVKKKKAAAKKPEAKSLADDF